MTQEGRAEKISALDLPGDIESQHVSYTSTKKNVIFYKRNKAGPRTRKIL